MGKATNAMLYNYYNRSSRTRLSITDVDSSIANFSNDALVSDALARGIDLREYADSVAKELVQVQTQHINDYVAKETDLRSLHSQINDCDKMLANMVTLLEGFQVDLNKISGEIRDLQERSNDMNLRLKNRSSHELLNKVLDGLVITPDLITKICQGEVNEFFLDHLLDLNEKMAYVKSQRGAHIKALKDVGPELERMRLKASEKIREYLLKRIEGLKTPNTNIAIIQQNHLLKFKQLYWFLLERYSEAAQEIRAVYITTVQQYYLASFEKHVKALSNMQIVIVDRSDLIGSAETQVSGLGIAGRLIGAAGGLFTGNAASPATATTSLSASGNKPQLKDRSNVYSLGDRVQVLMTDDAGIILHHIAQDQKLRFPYEAIFKSINRLLMDNASSEYIFTTEFFLSPWKKGRAIAAREAIAVLSASSSPASPFSLSNSSSSPSSAATSPDNTSFADPAVAGAVFAEIFEPTLRFIQGALKYYIDNSYDAVGILLCIRLNAFHLRIMQKRRIPCLESFMNLLNIMLWPRFQAIIDMHIESLRRIVKIPADKDCHPHFITRRYAEFAASILALNDGFDDALLINSLVRLRNEVENLLFRMCQNLPDRKDQLVLLINNHDLVLSVLGEYNHLGSSCFDQENEYFASNLETQTGEFVEEELKNRFGFLMEFVDRAELERNLDVLDTSRFETVASQ
ncbi:hypothetical protein HK100_008030, partial [Physocladia obscura]